MVLRAVGSSVAPSSWWSGGSTGGSEAAGLEVREETLPSDREPVRGCATAPRPGSGRP